MGNVIIIHICQRSIIIFSTSPMHSAFYTYYGSIFCTLFYSLNYNTYNIISNFVLPTYIFNHIQFSLLSMMVIKGPYLTESFAKFLTSDVDDNKFCYKIDVGVKLENIMIAYKILFKLLTDQSLVGIH